MCSVQLKYVIFIPSSPNVHCEFSENKCAKILKFTGSPINTVNKKKIMKKNFFSKKKKSGLKGLIVYTSAYNYCSI